MNYQINLIRRRAIYSRERRVKHFLFYLFSLILSVSLLVIFSFYLANSYFIRAGRGELSRLRGEIEKLGVGAERMAEIGERLRRGEKRLSLLRKVGAERVFWAERLATLKQLLPPGTVIGRLHSQGSRQIILEAYLLSRRGGVEEIGRLLARLEGDEAIGRARLLSLTEDAEKGLISFSLSLSFL